MNKADKKTLDELIDKVDTLRGEVEEILGTQQDAFEDMSEKKQQGEKGEALQSVISSLEEAMDDLDRVKDALARAFSEAQ